MAQRCAALQGQEGPRRLLARYGPLRDLGRLEPHLLPGARAVGAGEKFTAVGKASVAPASNRVFITVLRGDSAGQRLCLCIAGPQIEALTARPYDVTLS